MRPRPNHKLSKRFDGYHFPKQYEIVPNRKTIKDRCPHMHLQPAREVETLGDVTIALSKQWRNDILPASGQTQVTKEKERVKRAMLLPVMSYLLLLRLYETMLDPDQGFTICQPKRQFCDEVWQEQLDCSDTK